MFLESTQNQRCFNVEFYGWINVDKSTLNQRGYQVDRRHDVISTYINVESTLSVCWAVLKSVVKVTDLFKKCSDGYIRKDHAPDTLCPRCKEREGSQPHFIFYCKLSKTTPDFISELIHLNYYFNIPFKISLKAIINDSFFSIP